MMNLFCYKTDNVFAGELKTCEKKIKMQNMVKETSKPVTIICLPSKIMSLIHCSSLDKCSSCLPR